MKQVLGIFLLLLNLVWLANAALIEPTAAELITHSKHPDENYALIRLQIISKVYPQLAEFLMRKYSSSIRLELPCAGFRGGIYAINPTSSKLIIIPFKQNFIGQRDNEFIIWDIKTNRMLHHIVDDRKWQNYSILATTGANKAIFLEGIKKVSIWDMNSGKKLHDLGRCCFGASALSPDESLLVTLTNAFIFIWDIETGLLIKKIPRDARWIGNALAVSPGAQRIAISAEDSIKIIDTVTGKCISSIWHKGSAHDLWFNFDGTRIRANVVSLNDEIKSRATWDIATAQQFGRRYYEAGNSCDDFKGNKRIERKDSTVRVYDCLTDQFLCEGTFGWPFRINDHWLIATEQDGTSYAYDLDKLVAFQYEIASLSDLQLELIDRIRMIAENKTKFLLNRNNPELARIIEAYDMLPASIKVLVSDHVLFRMNQQINQQRGAL